VENVTGESDSTVRLVVDLGLKVQDDGEQQRRRSLRWLRREFLVVPVIIVLVARWRIK
jgi:hypothetical protein